MELGLIACADYLVDPIFFFQFQFVYFSWSCACLYRLSQMIYVTNDVWAGIAKIITAKRIKVEFYEKHEFIMHWINF